MMAELVTALDLIGLSLTITSLYGFLASRITRRRGEIGIRMALAATRQAATPLGSVRVPKAADLSRRSQSVRSSSFQALNWSGGFNSS